MTDDRRGSLLAWQWFLYPGGHRDRRNLLVHALTVPVFQMGTVALVMAPFVNGWLAALGVGAMVGTMALQGRTHRLERTPPAPFRGPADVVARIFVEQWLTFPRYVASGGFHEAWLASAPERRRPGT
ncbi:MAG TPA: terminase [Myxococcaceae bacterium]|nr:terminase [Myxococcaceae bacterium]